jgi:hypothetical protein
MDVSLILCTKNRARQLADALPHYARLKASASWEAILVNNGSTDATAEVLASFAKSVPTEVVLLDETKVGVSAARNTGRKAARGNVIAFTDDDCYPAADYIDQIHRCFAEADLGYLGGRVLLFDRKDLPITIQPLEHRVDIPPHSFIRMGLIHGANMAFRRDVLERVGDFDERMGPGSELHCGEDNDILTRASSLGYAGAYDPRPMLYHHHRRSTREEFDRLMARYDVGRGAYFAKALMDRRRRWVHLWPAVRKIGGNIRRREFSVMRREFQGAWKYVLG